MPIKEMNARRTDAGNIEITVLGATAIVTEEEALQFADEIMVEVAESVKANGYSKKRIEPDEQ